MCRTDLEQAKRSSVPSYMACDALPVTDLADPLNWGIYAMPDTDLALATQCRILLTERWPCGKVFHALHQHPLKVETAMSASGVAYARRATRLLRAVGN
eukprot:3940358-Rhodomonas_salina.2